MKPFTEITTDAEYLRAVGMGPEKHPELWTVGCDRCRETARADITLKHESWCKTGGERFFINSLRIDQSLALHNPDPAHKWRDLANVMQVLGPEIDRRGFSYECFLEHVDHLTLLEAFYNAHHAQGE